VWQKTGRNTLAATWLVMEYRVLILKTDEPGTNPRRDSPLFRFDKVQYTGTLNRSGDSMDVSALLTFYDEQGNQVDVEGNPSTEGIPFEIKGVRIPLEVLPSTTHRLTIPPIPPTGAN
jgi:hypothetical protein